MSEEDHCRPQPNLGRSMICGKPLRIFRLQFWSWSYAISCRSELWPQKVMYCGGAATIRPTSAMMHGDAIVVYHGQYGRSASRSWVSSSVDTLGDFTLYTKDLQEDPASLLYNVSG